MTKNKKILILDSRPSVWRKQIEKNGVSIEPVYRKMNLFNRGLRKMTQIIHQYKDSNWYGEWGTRLVDFDVIFVFIYSNSEGVIKFISEKKIENQRVIAWYWNPVYRVLSPDILKKYACELWSFDSKDCIRYDMRFNTTFYFKDFVIKKDLKENTDVVFLGLNKGRLSFIEEIEKKLQKYELTTCFHIVNEGKRFRTRKNYVPYEVYLDWINKSKCILDVLQEDQQGMTLRVMESLFLQKKLMTTCVEIEKEDFYHPDNIFIINKDSWENVHEFLSKPYHFISKEVVNRYEFKNWLNRFG